MDNRTIDITSEGDKGLELALRLIWENAAGGKATHFRVAKVKEVTRYFGRHFGQGAQPSHQSELIEDIDGTPTLIFYWSMAPGAQPLDRPTGSLSAAVHALEWLNEVDYGNEPDHDGSNGKGWRVFTEAWGHVLGSPYAIAAVQPAWAMYGK